MVIDCTIFNTQNIFNLMKGYSEVLHPEFTRALTHYSPALETLC